jgi:hypothetical protein
VALGIAFGVLIFFSPGQMQVLALTPDVAAIMLVGGLICLGLGGIAAAIESRGGPAAVADVVDEEPAVMGTPEAPPIPDPPRVPGFGRKLGAAAAAAGAATEAAAEEVKEAGAKAADAAKTTVADTIAALEKAKSDINAALGGAESHEAPATTVVETVTEVIEDVVEEAPAAEEAAGDGGLFVVEEKLIRGRPARVLSDGTVEAETDEGWMRFENLEHLDEYLDAATGEA